MQCGARDGAGERHDLGAVGIEQRRWWCRRGVAFATSAEIKQSRTQGSVKIIDDGHVGCLVGHGGSHGVALPVGDELALGDDYEIRRLELPQQKRAGALIGKSLAEVRGVDQNDHTIEAEPITLGPGHDLCGVSDAAELNHHMIRWCGSAAHVGKRGAEAFGDGAAHTSVGELNRVGGTPLEKGSINVDLTDVVDQHGDRAVGATQQIVEQRRLPATEIPTEEGHRHPTSVPRRNALVEELVDLVGGHGSTIVRPIETGALASST